MKFSVKPSRYIGLLTGLAAGLYPLLFYVSNNYTLVNSWGHLGYFLSVFLVAPIVFLSLLKGITRLAIFKRVEKFVLPFFNIFIFLFFVKTALYAGFQIWIVVGIFLISLVYALIFHSYFLKVVVFQLLLAVVASFYLIPVIIGQLQYSKDWMTQPDAITQVQFKKKPNVYLIQPDGYVSFFELKQGFYKQKNNELENFLQQESFTSYSDFRSNYASTLTSNSSLFTMKHHYYLGSTTVTEMRNTRAIIMGNNPVLAIFKNNGYTTNFLAERPYLLANKPKIGYDSSNYLNQDLSYITTGLKEIKDIVAPLKLFLEKQDATPAFHFIEIFTPGHIAVNEIKSEGIEKERDQWLATLPETDEKIIEIVSLIKEKDANGIIIILADHGGFVGLKHMHEAYTKTQDRDKLYSMFGANLAIYWPAEFSENKIEIKSSVNVFRTLFSYLGEDSKLLENIQGDASYLPILHGAIKGVYKVIDSEGSIVFEKR